MTLQENVAALTDHFVDDLFAKTLRASMTLWRSYDVQKFDADVILLREILCIFFVANMSFNAIRENKILAKFPNLQYSKRKPSSSCQIIK